VAVKANLLLDLGFTEADLLECFKIQSNLSARQAAARGEGVATARPNFPVHRTRCRALARQPSCRSHFNRGRRHAGCSSLPPSESLVAATGAPLCRWLVMA